MLGGKCLTTIGHTGLDVNARLLHILKPLTAIKRQQQMFLVGSSLNASRISQDNGSILIAAVHSVNHDAVQHAPLHIFLGHIEVSTRNTVVEDALRNFHLGILLLHREQQLLEGDKGSRTDDFLKEERDAGNGNGNDYQGAHGLHQRNTCSLNGRQLRTLAQVAKGDERRQQNG